MDSSKSSNGEGNTKPLPKQVSPAKKWCFTLNNYTDDECSSISSIVPKVCSRYVVGKEVGEQGTPHLQGFLEFKVKCRPMSHFPELKRIHWEKCKGTTQQNEEYCIKEQVWLRYPKPPREIQLITPDRWWQVDILAEIANLPHDRLIHWYWSEEGGTGKTSFCKYLVVKHKAMITGGKAADVRNCVVDWMNKSGGETPELVCINIPKSFNAEYVSYEGFENIKDMLFYSGKYEGGMVCGNPPHLFIFANFPPDESKMTAHERFNVVNIDSKKRKREPEEDSSLAIDFTI